MLVNHLGLYLRSCLFLWFGIYLGACFLMGLPMVVVHVMGVGFFLCVISLFRLPPPDPASALTILGPDPRNFDGSPAKIQGSPPIAHRAAGSDAPENTIAALRLAKKNGARCIEFDVSFTLDGIAVVFHDDTLERTTDGKGRIDEKTYDEIKNLDASHTHVFKQDYSPEKIPTVDEFVEECLKLDLKMIIDLKSFKTPEPTAAFVCNLYKKHNNLYKNAMVSTFFPHLAYLIRKQDPNIVMGMAWRPYFISYQSFNGILGDAKPRFTSPLQHVCALFGDMLLKWALHEFLWYFIGLSAVLIQKDALTKEYLQTWRERGVRVIAWTVNNTPQRVYLTNYLRCTVLSDSMDQLSLSDYVVADTPDEKKDTSSSSSSSDDEK